MQQVFEAVMLVCFGISWPVSILKSYKARSARGKSPVFLILIILGYAFGIAAKIAAETFFYVGLLYVINMIMVSIDLILWFRNRRIDLKSQN